MGKLDAVKTYVNEIQPTDEAPETETWLQVKAELSMVNAELPRPKMPS